MDMAVLAVNNVGHGIAIVVGPAVFVIALLVWLTLTRMVSRNPRTPDKFCDQDNHRGPEQGGYFRHTPGSHSHSYAQSEHPHYSDENR